MKRKEPNIISMEDMTQDLLNKAYSCEISKEQALDKLNSEFRKEIEESIIRACPPECDKNDKDCDQCGFRMNCNGRLIFVTFRDRAPVFTEITFEHFNVPGVYFSLAEESDGTQRLLDLLSVLFIQKENSVFVIDEIDRSLHPQLTMQFIKSFLKLAENKNIQLIITTHESHLLNLKLLRQDEIFFVEAGHSGESILYPFDKFKERFDKKIEDAYLRIHIDNKVMMFNRYTLRVRRGNAPKNEIRDWNMDIYRCVKKDRSLTKEIKEFI